MPQAKPKAYLATVGSIEQGRYGPYAVAYNDELGTVTFSLASNVWQENQKPYKSLVVVIEDVRKMARGWRAVKARFMRPEDQYLSGTQKSESSPAERKRS